MEAPVCIEVNDKIELVLTWPDGNRTIVSARTARAGCTCATCRSSDGGAVLAANAIGGATIESAGLVGAYAINLVFGPDGHKTGIFDWPTLRMLGEPVRGDP